MKKGMAIIFTISSILLTTFSFVAFFNKDLDVMFWLSFSLSIAQLIVALYCLFIWRLFAKVKHFSRFVPKDINGNYEGTLISDYSQLTRDDKKEKLSKSTELTIEQDLYGAKITTETNQIYSSSTLTGYRKLGTDMYELTYIYETRSKQENNKNENPISHGTAILIAKGDTLEGEYWTTNNTTGSMKLIRVGKNNKGKNTK